MTQSLSDYAKAHRIKPGPTCRVCLSGKHVEIVAAVASGVPYMTIADWLVECCGVKAGPKALAASVARHIKDGHTHDQ